MAEPPAASSNVTARGLGRCPSSQVISSPWRPGGGGGWWGAWDMVMNFNKVPGGLAVRGLLISGWAPDGRRGGASRCGAPWGGAGQGWGLERLSGKDHFMWFSSCPAAPAQLPPSRCHPRVTASTTLGNGITELPLRPPRTAASAREAGPARIPESEAGSGDPGLSVKKAARGQAGSRRQACRPG